MIIDSAVFERYRRSPNEKTTLLRLLLGTAIVVFLWLAMTFVVLVAGTYAFIVLHLPGLSTGRPVQDFLASPVGILTALASFAGIWIGLWVAMRFLHGEPLSALIGTSRRISRGGFLKGLVAVLITSLFSEVLLYWLQPEIARGPIALSSWLLFLVPIALLAFLQTSSEETLFRGYLLRGLASRFASPLIWAALPGLLFTALHWSSTSTLAINACVLVSIATFALLLTLLVYVTGNLGAAFGAHLGNNLTGFLLISHQESYNSFALFNAKPLEGPGWTNWDAVLIAAIGIASTLLTMLLLFHRRSPLKVGTDGP
ncbi:CPBP family intramembrane metalloprotease [Mesorhizobium sp. M1C.F.Ca.ET.193.01.1.1]|uniref:CPBP family intramembrane glutamic endopeptidase n=1 Tax=unclassified Mesorhizobium TaxID=325217 RepID=UPI000FD267CB|nr:MULTISPECIES: type II CAAX endopeptidase family protein [unclassified Mesorhizobium]TGS93048.1 CPBP family intramembrane metalloprotease [bacterium M00.F.Ca.ET.177.01.1.1]TGQ50572.1 CPBP family intramembrane metalloprotease [Mesorhizobium sp. M1C.F.Ca.ET.210.01.1.1]TGQ65747.1 CPBP family intramembrane metalloprotease [Mesorhizobium sp. M1C.F.Ca.ET.212.01.1.1]TGQ99477.1 CPBP family intramembrane metalloprotease [Mesorhizobium sp. M1C.F.Ca.ET.204.01.1.1]TGR19882.1 CPBP family intramembrane me